MSGTPRKERAKQVRYDATNLAFNRPDQPHRSNGEEEKYGGYNVNPLDIPPYPLDCDPEQIKNIRTIETAVPFMTFSKGLPHNATSGIANFGETVLLRSAINSGRVEAFDCIPIGGTADVFSTSFYGQPNAPKLPRPNDPHRRWEAPTAGFVYDLEGPDAQAVTMPPAPVIRENRGQVGDELVAEMAEVYWLSLLRDEHFSSFESGGTPSVTLDDAVTHLQSLNFYQTTSGQNRTLPNSDFKVERTRRNPRSLNTGAVFRGQTDGDLKGPYISQFLLIGNEGIGAVPGSTAGKPKFVNRVSEGFLQYGSIRIDQKVRIATPGVDYMTHWNEWLDVQNGANVRDTQSYEGVGNSAYRFITTPRDLATYVHFDALYEAYLNACLWLLSVGAPADPNFRDILAKSKSTEGFAQFGGPHILSLVTEVATRALKAVRFQKFNNHLRLRPEALAGLIAAEAASGNNLHNFIRHIVSPFKGALDVPFQSNGRNTSLLGRVKAYNNNQNTNRHSAYLATQAGIAGHDDLPLLPMAFPEGSPMHPAYGAGHATVAGACVTILKAFFDESAILMIDDATGRHTAILPNDPDRSGKPFGYRASPTGKSLVRVRQSLLDGGLRVGDELNKLAANISIGRNMAGVHYYSDYIDSLTMGEEIAVGIMCELALTYRDTNPFSMSFETFGGKMCTINRDGQCAVVHKP